MSYGERGPGVVQDRCNSEDSLEDNQSTTSSTESRQSDFNRKASDEKFIPTRTSGILASKPAANPNQFTRVNSNPLVISAQKQMLLVDEAKKKKEQERKQIVGDDTPDWQSNLDGWKLRRRKQSEDAIERLTEIKRFGDDGTEISNRKSSISRKISAQYTIDDEIDFDDLNVDDEGDGNSSSLDTVDIMQRNVSSTSSTSNNGGSRRESRGVSQEKVIPEEDEEEEEENDSNPVKVANHHHHHNHYNGAKDNAPISTSPYDSAIEGYKSFAKSKLNGTTDNHKVNFSDDSDRSSSLSTSASTSSMSPAPTAPSSSSHRQSESVSKHDDEWEEKIETFVQPARRVSSEISDKMKQKLANFEDSKSGKEQTPVRLIEPDNSFKDKLKAFKTIESSVSESVAAPAKSMPSRRESEPNLPNIKPKVMPGHRSTSSSFMNTFQNNKFFQQNSLGSSDKDDDSLSSNHQLLDDALEESFNDILEDEKKAPPLPAVPPPDIIDQQKLSQMENEIDKQEREIIESLEREEEEHKKYLASSSSSSSQSGLESSSVVQTRVSKSQTDLQRGHVSSTSTGTGTGTQTAPAGWRSESLGQLSNARGELPRKKNEGSKDYNKHWLYQEAEQRRISEAKQKHNPGAGQQNIEKIENINNNNGGLDYQNYSDKHRGPALNNISDNIYANVDANNINYNKDISGGPPDQQHYGDQDSIPQIPGPQVPPRLGQTQDKPLSVSGKKKCSHCKEELGRGAAMIIESLKLFYHIRCFKCCVCSIKLGNGETGTDVRVRNNRLHCQNCYSNDEGLKFSKV